MAALEDEPIAADAPELAAALLAAGLPVDDLLEDGPLFYRFARNGEPVAYGGLELHGEHALIRSLVVLPDHRGNGIGRATTDRLLRHALEAGARHAFLLTNSAASFFEASGFKRIERAAAPTTLLATRQAKSICTSATLLSRPIAGPDA